MVFHPRLLRSCPRLWYPIWCFAKLWRDLERTPATHFPRRKLRARQRYGSFRTSAASIAGEKTLISQDALCPRLSQRSSPACLDGCLACWLWTLHVVPYMRSTPRHSHSVEPPDVSAGVGNLRLKMPLPSVLAREQVRQTPLSQATRCAAPRSVCLRLDLSSKGVSLIHLPAMRWWLV